MSDLTICMKSGKIHNVNSEFKNINEMLKGTMPRYADASNWACFSLVEKDEFGNDNVLLDGKEIESFKYLGETK